MGKPEVEIIESGRRWMAGEVSSAEYFSNVARSAAVHPGWELVHRFRAVIADILRSSKIT